MAIQKLENRVVLGMLDDAVKVLCEGLSAIERPSIEEICNKINEIIDYINASESNELKESED